jgi:hypothetical protein
MSDFWWQVAEQEQQEAELLEEQELELIEFHKWLDEIGM